MGHRIAASILAFGLLPAGLDAAGCGSTQAAPLSAPSKLILENDRVRVSEISVARGGSIPKPVWAAVELEDKSAPNAGKPWQSVGFRWVEADKSEKPSGSGAWHAVRIELKQADCPLAPAVLPDTDITKIPNSGFTIELENAHMRVLHGRIPPGEMEPWHTHTWSAVVCYFGLPDSRRTEADGTVKPRAGFSEMQVNFDQGNNPRHTIENLGKTLYQAYRIELKPVMGR